MSKLIVSVSDKRFAASIASRRLQWLAVQAPSSTSFVVLTVNCLFVPSVDAGLMVRLPQRS